MTIQIPAVGSVPLGLSARRSIIVLLWFFVVQLVFGVFLGVLIVVWGSATGEGNHAELVGLTNAWLIPGTVVGLALSAWVLWSKVRTSFPGAAWPTVKATLGLGPVSREEIALGTALGLGLALCYLFLLLRLFPPSPGQSFGPMATAAAAASFPNRLLYVVMAVAFAPPLEEFRFRGFLLAGFGNAWGLRPAVIIITLLFALGHLSEVRSYWPAILAITALACGTMALRLRFRSLWPAVAMHAGYNGTLMMVLLVSAG